MITLTLAEIVEAIGAANAADAPVTSVVGVSTDSRAVRAGELFFALRGPRFDGHDYAAEALERGAVAAVVAADRFASLAERVAAQSLLAVDDPLAALGRLAAWHRLQHPADVVAVVGSNGKTTTKEMIHHVLSARRRGRCSHKSFNNAVGVPLTLLSAAPSDDYLVVEIGTNAPGEVAALSALVRPDMAVLTSIGEEHLEGLRDLEGVAAEECAVLRHVPEGGFAAVNIDAPHASAHLGGLRGRLITFGRDPRADLRLTACRYESPWLTFELNGRFEYRLHAPGEHNALNAAAAVAVARRLGLGHDEIAERLRSFVPPPMRSEIIRMGGVTVVNDAYNANPHSALAALAALDAVANGGRRIVVFGEMRELGEQAVEQHRRIAERLKDARLDRVLLVGRAAELMYDVLKDGDLFAPGVERCESVEACAERLGSVLRDGDVVLLKASRAVGLERVVEPLRARLAKDSPGALQVGGDDGAEP